MKQSLSVIDVAHVVRLYEPISTTALSRQMGVSVRQAEYAVKKARRMGFVRQLPNDTRWWIVRMG